MHNTDLKVKDIVITEKISKITLSSTDDKRMQLIYSIETCQYGTSKVLVSEKIKRIKQKIKCSNKINNTKND